MRNRKFIRPRTMQEESEVEERNAHTQDLGAAEAAHQPENVPSMHGQLRRCLKPKVACSARLIENAKSWF